MYKESSKSYFCKTVVLSNYFNLTNAPQIYFLSHLLACLPEKWLQPKYLAYIHIHEESNIVLICTS